MSLFQMSVYGGILILFILFARLLTINRLPKSTFLILWIITAFRLLLPFSIPLTFKFSISNIDFPKATEDLLIQNSNFTSLEKNFSSYDVQINNLNSKIRLFFTIIWLIGFILLLTYFFISYIQSVNKFKMSIPDNTLYIQSWLNTHKIIRPIQVRISDQILSPLTYGFFRPVILLPKRFERNDEITLKYILTHEYVHIRRLDAFIKIIFTIVLCIHWFNPLVWLMYIISNKDMELSCDAQVIRIIGEKNRSSYALTLITIAEKRNAIFNLCNHFSKNTVTERIEAIMKFKKTSALAITLATFLVVGATTAFATTANQPEGNEQLTNIGYNISKSPDFKSVKITNSTPLQYADEFYEQDNHQVVDIEKLPHINFSQIAESAQEMNTTLISVSHDDKSKFTEDEWTEILNKIEKGEIYWED